MDWRFSAAWIAMIYAKTASIEDFSDLQLLFYSNARIKNNE